MRRNPLLATLLVFVCLSPSLPAQPAAPEEAETYGRRVEALVQDGKHSEALDVAASFIRKHPGNRWADYVLHAVVRCRWNEPELLPKVDEVLRLAMNDYPFRRCARGALEAVEATRHWSFGERERRPDQLYKPGEDVWFGSSRRGGPDSTFRLLRVPASIQRRVLGELSTDKWYELDSALYAHRGEWETVIEITLLFEYGIGRKGFDYTFDEPGRYYLEEEIDGFRRLEHFDIVNYALCASRVGRDALVATLDPWTGGPVSGVAVTIRTGERTVEGRTDANGLFRAEVGSEAIVVSRIRNEVHSAHIDKWWDEESAACHVSLDRPLYRPGDPVHYKAVRRDRLSGELKIPADPKVRVHIKGPDEVELVDTVLELNELGTLSGTAALPADASPGSWYLTVMQPARKPSKHEWESVGWATFRVAKFERPEVRIGVDADPRTRVLGSPVRALVRAEHWWGAPAEGVEVGWEICAYTPEWPDMKWERTGRWQPRPWPDSRDWFYQADPDESFHGYLEDFELAGSGKTGPDGVLAIEFETEPGKEPVNYQVSVRAVGASGREIKAWADVIVRPAEVRVRAGTTRMFYEPGETAEGRVTVVDLDGNPVPDREVRIDGLRGTAYGKTIEFNGYGSTTVRTGPDGHALFRLDAPPSGRMRVRVTVKDDAGRSAIHRSDRWVASERTIRRQEDNDDAMMLPDRAVYAAGETARILVDTELFEGPLLLMVAGDGIHEARFIQLERRFQVIEVPVLPAYAPNAYVKLLAVRGGEYDKEFAAAAGCELLVLPPGGWVDIGLETDRGEYGPRNPAKITVETSVDGAPVPAEVEIAIVDESIFALEEDETEDLRHFFWQSWEDESSWWAPGPLREMGLDHWNKWIHTARNEGHGFGFGEGAPPAAAGFAPAEIRTRGPDTLLWSGTVRTDESGQAAVEFTTSDRLTTWRVLARAVSGVDRFGQAETRLVTEQKVVVMLGVPPSMTERDEGVVRVSMRNDLDQAEDFLLQLEVEGAGEGGGVKRLKVEAGTAARAEFPLRATGPGTIRLVAGALSVTGSDMYEKTIPVRAHGTVTVNSVTAPVDPVWATTLTLPDKAVAGSARLRITADTIPRVVQRALPTLVDWQVGHYVDELAWRLTGVLRAREVLEVAGMDSGIPADRLDRLVGEDLFRLGSAQESNGGFRRSRPFPIDRWTTSLVIDAMELAKEAGHPVPRRVLADAHRWILGAGGRHVREPVGSPPDRLMAGRLGASWPTPLDTAHAIDYIAIGYLASGSEAAEPPELTATVYGKPLKLTDGRCEIGGDGLLPGAIGIRLEKGAGGRVYGSATLTYEDPEAEGLVAESHGLHVSRSIELREVLDDESEVWQELPPGVAVGVGDRLRIVLLMRGEARTGDVTVVCPLPGGVVSRGAGHVAGTAGRWLDFSEFHPDRVVLHLHHLGPAASRYIFEIRPVLPGTWHTMPAEAVMVDSPEVRGRSAEVVLRVE